MLSVIISRTQSANPAKQKLEEGIVAGLAGQRGIGVAIVPNLYDLHAEGKGISHISTRKGDLLICGWLYPRAAHWILDRSGVRGQVGETLLDGDNEDDGEEQIEEVDEEEDKIHVADQRDVPDRTIYCLDLRSHETAQPYIEEILRIDNQSGNGAQLEDWIRGTPKPEQVSRFLHPRPGNVDAPAPVDPIKLNASEAHIAVAPTRIDDDAARRWYPVIDYSRCTNCMECIDFCLFGVYGVDGIETILVEQPDNCRKGCPACSRVCPENAIIFPQHKTPAIAGSAEVVGPLKIDLSKLFGGDDGASADEMAARERDEQLVLAGRQAVGTSVGMPKRQQDQPKGPKDDLDQLMDHLEELDL